jgi:hypothetical protein
MDIELKQNFVFNPDQYYSPSYRISPFQTSDIAYNKLISRTYGFPKSFEKRFGEKDWVFTKSGKHAITLALHALKLGRDDNVTILTTSGNKYISGCVTREIEKVCQWSRTIQSNTAAIFVNHEFGYPYRNMKEIKKFGVPIIEDACHSFFADTENHEMNLNGDFMLYSLPKSYPIQIGGVLAFNSAYQIDSGVHIGTELHEYLLKVIMHYEPQLDDMKAKRLGVYHALAERFSSIGAMPFFEISEIDCPNVFMFSFEKEIDLADLRTHCWSHGIESSVFYGKQAFFIPSHNRLMSEDVDYFHNVVSRYVKD